MRIAVVNDVKVARELLMQVVRTIPGCEVCWTAGDGAEALSNVRRDRPDLVLMDLYMPEMDGVEATKRIMSEQPCPILVVTGSLKTHLQRVYDALGFGALDAVETPAIGPSGALVGADSLLKKIATVQKLTGGGKCPRTSAPLPSVAPPVHLCGAVPPLVLLGSSTGGPAALAKVLQGLAAGRTAATTCGGRVSAVKNPAVVAAQHIGAEFSHGLAEWLTVETGWPVKIAKEGDVPTAGTVLVASGDAHLIFGSCGRLTYTNDCQSCVAPSIDMLFRTAAVSWPRLGVAVVLTGMGSDGAHGQLLLRQRGWKTIAQDEGSCTVYGMPKAACELGAAAQTLPLEKIAPAVLQSLAKLHECAT
ncbi:MAG TPA: chemotaxis-specific protein-glutamate methyltransferase CheB [Pirellulales bacterium]